MRIELVTPNLPTKKSSGLNGGECYRIFKEELTLVFKFSPQKKEKGTLPNSPYEFSITQMPKLNKHTKRKKNYRLDISDEY